MKIIMNAIIVIIIAVKQIILWIDFSIIHKHVTAEVLNDPSLPVSLSCTSLFCFDLRRTDVFLLSRTLLNSKF